MNYRVWLTTPKPIVIDDHGNEIANAYVHEIKFPPAAIHTANGTVWVIGGPGVALI
jgi:hypothetical protein